MNPLLLDDEESALVGSTRGAVLFHHLGLHAKERDGATSRLRGRDPGQRRHHDRAGFRLPPGVHNGAAPAADLFVVPHPRLWVDGLADAAEQPQRGEIVPRGVLVAPSHEGADGRRRRVKDRHLVFFDDRPESIFVRRVGRPFVNQGGGAVG